MKIREALLRFLQLFNGENRTWTEPSGCANCGAPVKRFFHVDKEGHYICLKNPGPEYLGEEAAEKGS